VRKSQFYQQNSGKTPLIQDHISQIKLYHQAYKVQKQQLNIPNGCHISEAEKRHVSMEQQNVAEKTVRRAIV